MVYRWFLFDLTSNRTRCKKSINFFD